MKYGDLYTHYKQKEYFFISIALPLNEYRGCLSELRTINLAYDAHTPEGEEPWRVQLYAYKGITFINKDAPHVIYQSEDDYETDKVWAREVDEFFGMKNITPFKTVRRYIKIAK
ncbi:hypothetical protein OCC47_16145 [Bacillus cereus]|nr:hypothetical protein [Bacillus cereus]